MGARWASHGAEQLLERNRNRAGFVRTSAKGVDVANRLEGPLLLKTNRILRPWLRRLSSHRRRVSGLRDTDEHHRPDQSSETLTLTR
jgi:hypothetical protein